MIEHQFAPAEMKEAGDSRLREDGLRVWTDGIFYVSVDDKNRWLISAYGSIPIASGNSNCQEDAPREAFRCLSNHLCDMAFACWNKAFR